MEQIPGGLHETDARILRREFEFTRAEAERQNRESNRQDEMAWNAARAARTIEAMDGYLSNWPGGLHVEEGHDLRRRLSSEINDVLGFKSASKLNTIEAYQTYLKAFPNGSQVATANAMKSR